MRKIVGTIVICSLITSCVVVREKDRAPGKLGTSGIINHNGK